MNIFVDREEEMQLIEERCTALMQNKPVPQQIVEFHGVGGIGKTTILKRVKRHCNEQHLPSIWTDANQSIAFFSHEVIQQVQTYGVQFAPKNNDLLSQSIDATKALIDQKPAVFLIDSLDSADDEQLGWIEQMLDQLTKGSRLLFVLASQRKVSFEHTMSIARKLEPIQVKSLNRKHCIDYVNQWPQQIAPEIQEIVFEWTGGYPLAVNVMVKTIQDEKLDPRKDKDQKQLMQRITEQVIDRSVLARAVSTPADLEWYQTMLGLFSIPRRYNLDIMQKMTEKFAPHYKLSSNLAYMSLPKRLDQRTDVLSWDRSRSGYSLEAPIRHIFLTKLKIEQPERYMAIHKFLAETNWRLAMESPGTDRVRYLQEYLYHSANCENGSVFPQVVEKTFQQIVSEPTTYFSIFREEYDKDEELRAVLDSHTVLIASHMYQHLAKLNWQVAIESSRQDPKGCIFSLQEFFYYSICNPTESDILSLAQRCIQQIVKEMAHEVCSKLYEELSRDMKILERLKEHAHILSSLNPGNASS
jgi:hypothetical protein